MRNKLSAIQVKNAQDNGSLSDGGGLILLRRAGAGRWIYRYSHLGKRRDMGLGPQSSVTLSEARKRRDEWAAVLAAGQDPISARDAQRTAATAERDKTDPPFAEMVATVFEARKATLRGDGARGRWLSPLALYVTPAIGRKRMSEIAPADIKAALATVWRQKHPTGQKAIQRVRIVFRDAQMMGVDCDPFTVDQAKVMLGAVKHQVRHITATPWEDIPGIYAALVDRGDTPSALAARWAILTLARSMAVRGVRFDEIDGSVWTIPADRVKGREGQAREFRVPLSAEAVEISRIAGQYSGTFAFPSPRRGHISDVAVSKLLRKIGGGTLHGFRTTFRTWVQDTGACSWDVAETVLGHQIGNKVERSYARSDLLEPRRIALEAWARHVTGTATNVVRIDRGQ